MTLATTTNCAAAAAPVRSYTAPGKPNASQGELSAMRSGMGDLVDLLTYARPHDSAGETAFIDGWLLPRLARLGFEVSEDGFGNLWGAVPSKSLAGPAILWSCHIDTVHNPNVTRQGVVWAEDGRTLKLAKGKPGCCLGADDGAGLWLMLRMIAAGVPGGYVFHRGEEKGRLGSLYVANHEPELLKGWDACVAFDRRDYQDFITHQMGERCASEAFAETMCKAINGAGAGLSLEPDDTGSYTDSYSYASAISECCNVSVGYDREHGPNETLDALHLWRLAQAMCAVDLSAVVCERDCTVIDYGESWGYGSGRWARGGVEGWGSGVAGSRTGARAWGDDAPQFDDAGEQLLEFIRRYPAATADLLQMYGLGVEELAESLSPTELTQATGAGLLGAVWDDLGGGWRQD